MHHFKRLKSSSPSILSSFYSWSHEQFTLITFSRTSYIYVLRLLQIFRYILEYFQTSVVPGARGSVGNQVIGSIIFYFLLPFFLLNNQFRTNFNNYASSNNNFILSNMWHIFQTILADFYVTDHFRKIVFTDVPFVQILTYLVFSPFYLFGYGVSLAGEHNNVPNIVFNHLLILVSIFRNFLKLSLDDLSIVLFNTFSGKKAIDADKFSLIFVKISSKL